jgi:hypothetical protein
LPGLKVTVSNACDQWFKSLPAEQKAILETLRALIGSTRKNIREAFKWNRPCYATEKGMFCYLHATRHHATLGFAKGTSLNDPHKLLEGTGKDMRHIKIASRDNMDTAAIKALLKQAARL